MSNGTARSIPNERFVAKIDQHRLFLPHSSLHFASGIVSLATGPEVRCVRQWFEYQHSSYPAASPEDYHGRKPTARELREIFRLETKRAISNDWVIRHNGRSLQLQPGQRRYGPTQSKALVCEWEDGTMRVYYRGERVAFTELKEPIRKTTRPMPAPIRPIVARKAKPDHPWRQGYQSMKPRIPNPGIATPLVGMRTSASP
jgi:hypothetical protein